MADRSLVFRFLGKDEVSGTFQKIGKESQTAGQKMGSAFKGFAKAGALAGVAGLGLALKTGFGEVTDYQKGLAQLQQGLKTTGNVAGISATGMEDLASKIQDYSGQTDDSVVAAEQLLLTFTNIRNEAGKGNDVFTQTTKIAADMAARLGGDASTSAIQLGKALNDPVKGVTALSRVGVSFDAVQKKQIASFVKSGQTMKAQKVILTELNKEFGGSAKAVGNTLGGQVEKTKRKFEDLSQQLVTALLPAMSKMISIGTGVLQFIQKHRAVLEPLVTVLGSAAAAMYLVSKAQKAWAAISAVMTTATVAETAAQEGLNVAMTANPIGIVVVALAALAAGLVYAYKHSETFRNIVQGALHGVESAAKHVANFFTGPLIHGVGTLVSYAVKGFKFLFDAWMTVVGGIINGAAKMFGWVPGLGGKLKGAARAFNNFRAEADAAMSGVANDAASWGNKTGANLALGVNAGLSAYAGQVQNNGFRFGLSVANAVRNGAAVKSPSRITTYVGKMLAEGLVVGFKGASAHVLHSLSSSTQKMLTGVSNGIQSALDRIQSKVKAARDAVTAVLANRKGLADSIRQALTPDLGGVFDGDGVLGNVGAYLGGQASKLKEFAGQLSALAKAHLAPALLQQIAGLGPDQGMQVAAQLLGGGTSIASANASEAAINKYAGAAGGAVANAAFAKPLAKANDHLRDIKAEARKQTRLLHSIANDVGHNPTAAEIHKDLLRYKRLTGRNLGLS